MGRSAGEQPMAQADRCRVAPSAGLQHDNAMWRWRWTDEELQQHDHGSRRRRRATGPAGDR